MTIRVKHVKSVVNIPVFIADAVDDADDYEPDFTEGKIYDGD